ncbi:MAG: hypothetical protein IT164_18435 [Bryobacterales bacterium]|nr:hypothetical protein [Bryobacterales bacterium]
MGAALRLAILGLACAASCVCASNPLVALREARLHTPEELEQAAAEAPDEAVALLRSGAPVLAGVLARAARAPLRVLLPLSRAACVPEAVCPAAAVFYRQIHAGEMTQDEALRTAGNRAAYFHRLVSLRVSAPGELFDRVLHQEAETTRSAWMEGGQGRRAASLDQMPGRDLYAVLAYGQREESEASFARIFDHVLRPRLSGGGLLAAMREAHWLRARHFLVEAIRAGREADVMALAASDAAAVLQGALRGVSAASDPPAEGALAAEIIEAYAALAPAGAFAAALRAEAETSERMAGILAAWLERVRPGAAGELEPLVRRYAAALPDAGVLRAATVCPRGVCTQRMMFFDDDDGVASFTAFHAAYAKDARWRWEQRGGYVRVWRRGESGVTVEVFANRPRPGSGAVSMAWEGAEKEAAMALAKIAGQAPGFVQRGHAYHVPKAVASIPTGARFVFLGGCRGTEHLRAVLDRAPEAQVVATRSTGTMDVNDPLLKAINDELADRGQVEWPAFWRAQAARLGGGRLFQRYIAPDRNGAVIFLQALRQARQEPSPPSRTAP